MHIHRVTLQNFRNISAVDLELTCGINILYGENAQGKTNFLESVYFCATGRSHRGTRDRDLIMISEKEAGIRVVTRTQDGGMADEIRMNITKDGKSSTINQLPVKKLGELYGRLSVVIFSPEDLSLVKAGPQNRRRFLDMELCHLYPVYYHNLRMYYKVLKQRNNLLKGLNRDKSLIETLDLWDYQLVEYGNKIIGLRRIFIERLGRVAAKNQHSITCGREDLEIIYRNHTDEDDFLRKLIKHRDGDVLRGLTSVGVHKDDIEFRVNGEDGRVFASQGQQRTAALAVKLAVVELARNEKGHPPVLLLDDVLSELDKGRQNYLLNNIDGLQTIITLTGAESATGGYLRKVGTRVFNVENGIMGLQNPPGIKS